METLTRMELRWIQSAIKEKRDQVEATKAECDDRFQDLLQLQLDNLESLYIKLAAVIDCKHKRIAVK